MGNKDVGSSAKTESSIGCPSSISPFQGLLDKSSEVATPQKRSAAPSTDPTQIALSPFGQYITSINFIL